MTTEQSIAWIKKCYPWVENLELVSFDHNGVRNWSGIDSRQKYPADHVCINQDIRGYLYQWRMEGVTSPPLEKGTK